MDPPHTPKIKRKDTKYRTILPGDPKNTKQSSHWIQRAPNTNDPSRDPQNKDSSYGI